MSKVFYLLLLLCSVLVSSFSQILLKKSANKIYKNIIQEYLNYLVISAYFLFFLAVFIDLFCLKFLPLSFLPIIEASSYVFIPLLSKILLKEKLSLNKIIGLSLICAGIALYVC